MEMERFLVADGQPDVVDNLNVKQPEPAARSV